MRSALLVSALFGLAMAVPRPQDMDFDEIDGAPPPDETGPPPAAVSDPVDYNSTAAADAAAAAMVADLSSPEKHKVKRTTDVNAPCAPQPDGYGPKPPQDTDSSFLSNAAFTNIAQGAPTPEGYQPTFQNLQASSSANSYLGLYTLHDYDTYKCQELCDSVPQCTAFNIYFERDPTVNPADACPNPPSFTNIKCTLWGSQLTPQTATNNGQYRRDFHVVIAGSNGYQKNNPPPSYPGYKDPTKLGGAINAPLTPAGINTYISMTYYPGIYDAGKCAAACSANTAYNKRHPRADGTYSACNFFNAYYIVINYIPDGTYCSFYTQPWSNQYATNYGQFRGSNHYYVTDSYSYEADPQDPGHK